MAKNKIVRVVRGREFDVAGGTVALLVWLLSKYGFAGLALGPNRGRSLLLVRKKSKRKFEGVSFTLFLVINFGGLFIVVVNKKYAGYLAFLGNTLVRGVICLFETKQSATSSLGQEID